MAQELKWAVTPGRKVVMGCVVEGGAGWGWGGGGEEMQTKA